MSEQQPADGRTPRPAPEQSGPTSPFDKLGLGAQAPLSDEELGRLQLLRENRMETTGLRLKQAPRTGAVRVQRYVPAQMGNDPPTAQDADVPKNRGTAEPSIASSALTNAAGLPLLADPSLD